MNIFMKIFLTAFLFLTCATGIYSQRTAKKPAETKLKSKSGSVRSAAVNAGVPAQENGAVSDTWVGKYAYTYTEPASAGSFAPVIEYLLIVAREGDSLTTHFTADGSQTNDDYTYTTKIKGNQLNFYFLKDLRPADMRVGHKKRGQFMGSLIKTTVRGKTRYQFKDDIHFSPQHPPVFKRKS